MSDRSLLEQLKRRARHHLSSPLPPDRKLQLVRMEAKRIMSMLRPDDRDRVVDFVLEQIGHADVVETATVMPLPRHAAAGPGAGPSVLAPNVGVGTRAVPADTLRANEARTRVIDL
jgi:hypothetical protein